MLKILRLAGGVLLLAASTALSGQNARVIDGDTIDMGGVRYRLHGIDAPEAGQLCNTAEGNKWPCGQAALEKLKEMVAGRVVACTPREKDFYDRWVATCRADSTDLNEAMIVYGLAWAFRKYSLDYVQAEERAQARRVGIWQAPTEAAWDYRANKWNGTASAAPVSGCPIKGNINSKHEKIYHTPWSRDYVKTKIDAGKGERWFCSEGEAIAAGWRPPQ